GTFGDCHDPSLQSYTGRRSMITACGHGVALALQGSLVAVLLELGQIQAQWLVAGFATACCGDSWLWYQCARFPHWPAMTVSMITFANLGMLLGWWADVGFGPSQSCSCCCGGTAFGIGMWAGMLLFGNLGMALGLRRPLDPDSATPCRWAMFGGGNLGMIL